MSAMNNDDGVGSTFYMEFPAVTDRNGVPARKVQSNDETPGKLNSNADNTQEGMAQDFDTGNMTIMFVCADDNEPVSFTDEFDGMFKSILIAHNGKEALNMLGKKQTDLVISDTDMPEMDGFELCHKIKGTLEISHIPVILLTTRTDARNKNLGYKMGADAFIPKPYEINQMYAIIRSQLGGRFEIKRQYNYGFFSKMNIDQTFSVTDEEFISSLNSLIEQFISDPSLNDDYILKQTGISRSVMKKKMEGLLGTDLAGYLTRIRISIVKDKLTNTDQDPESIAAETGFGSVDAMNKAFRRETGKTINEFKEN
jgi:CheY-like chemotaxis protein